MRKLYETEMAEDDDVNEYISYVLQLIDKLKGKTNIQGVSERAPQL